MNKALTAPLAHYGDPLILLNGTLVEQDELDEDVESVSHTNNVQTTLDAHSFQPSKRRSIKELPAEPRVLNACAAIFMYTIFGLSDRDIKEATKLTSAELDQCRAHAAYSECFETVVGEFINANSNLLVARIAAHGPIAFDSVAAIASKASVNGQKVKLTDKLRASQDILDRAGVRPKDIDARQIVNKNELRIVISKSNQDVTLELNGATIDA